MQRSMSLPRAVSPAQCGSPFCPLFFRKKADGKKQRGARLEGLPCGEPIARPPWCFRPPPVGRPGRSSRPQGCGLGRIWEDSLDFHFLVFSLGLARSHLGSGGRWGWGVACSGFFLGDVGGCYGLYWSVDWFVLICVCWSTVWSLFVDILLSWTCIPHCFLEIFPLVYPFVHSSPLFRG